MPEGFDYAPRRRVVGDNVEQQMHMVARGVDVGDQPVEEAVVVG